jgi:L-lactate dehydrogenase complex protein LldF
MGLLSVQLWGKGRDLPEFAKESFQTMWKKGKVQKNG